MEFSYFSRNGKLLPIEEADISLSNIEYQYGFGVYETIRVSKRIPYFLSDHIERLLESARIIGLAHAFSADSVARASVELIEKNGADTCNIKLLLIGGPSTGLRAGKVQGATLNILCFNPLFPEKKLYRDGVKTITVRHERDFPHAKTLNMLGSYLAYQKARSLNAYDALLVDRAGNIVEGTRTNFFCIRDRTLFSPPEEKILLGVTRKAVLKTAEQNGFRFEQQDINYTDISAYDGAFLTSTSSNILPIRSIDSTELGETPATLRELVAAFDHFIDRCKGEM